MQNVVQNLVQKVVQYFVQKKIAPLQKQFAEIGADKFADSVQLSVQINL